MASIRKRSDNSYQIIVSNGYIAGKKDTRTKTIKLDPFLTPKQIEKELQKQAALFENEVESGTYLDGSKITFAEFVDRWLKDYAEQQLQPKTLHSYKEILNSRIIPAMGHVKLNKLQPNHLLQFYNNLQEEGIRLDSKYIISPEFRKELDKKKITTSILSDRTSINIKTARNIINNRPTTLNIAKNICNVFDIAMKEAFIPSEKPGKLSSTSIRYHHRIISSILQTAVHWQIINSNPCDRVKPPKAEKSYAKYYDESQVEIMLAALENEHIKYKTAINLIIFGGMRLGELEALEWTDISFDNKTICISRSSQYLAGVGVYTKKPKNESSDRTISISQSVIELLKSYKACQNSERLKCGDLWSKEWESQQRLFTQWDGKPIFPGSISRWFKAFIKRNNLPDLTFHQIRHTNASLLIGQGVDIKTVSKRLGHAQTSTTVNIYAHALRRPDEEAAQKLENRFNKKSSSVKEA